MHGRVRVCTASQLILLSATARLTAWPLCAQKFADFYRQAIFIKFYGNTNESTKGLFTHRFKIPKTPTFLFLRAGTVHLQYTGTRKEKMDEALQKCLLPEENPLHEASPFKRQVWHSKLGLT